MYSDCNGTGAHNSPMVARHMAVSEALERWAFHATVHSERRSQFGFDSDGSSNGMAAYPGWTSRPARRAAIFEAFERYCLLNWWECKIDGQVRGTEWPGILAITFEPKPAVVCVLLFGRSSLGFYSYGHAAADCFAKACKRALLEFARNETVLRYRFENQGGISDVQLFNRLERRAWFFSTREGYELFQSRLEKRAHSTQPEPEVICDREITGPWSNYAVVWRFAFRPPSERFIREDEKYFFW
jgi:ribosomal protein S12 methylthiotransferase accessory factor YcaO